MWGSQGLNDYYSYQLIDKVINQLENNDTGDLGKLTESLKILIKKFKSITSLDDGSNKLI
jgi:hypothetical protein